MDFQAQISEFLTAAIIILMAVTVAIPISVLVAQSAGDRLKRGHAGRRRILSQISTFLGAADLLGRLSPPSRPTTAQSMPSPATQKRRAQKRLRTCLMGSLHTAAVTRVDNLCDVVDFSASGARVRLVDPMAEMSRITLGLRHFGFFPARVVWRNGEELGLQFDLAPEKVVNQMRGLLPRAAVAGAY